MTEKILAQCVESQLFLYYFFKKYSEEELVCEN